MRIDIDPEVAIVLVLLCSGPVADPGHLRMARAIHGWPGIRDWPGDGGLFAESATGLATIQKSKNYLSS